MMEHFRDRNLVQAVGLDEEPPSRAALRAVRAVLCVRADLILARPNLSRALLTVVRRCPKDSHKLVYLHDDHTGHKLALEGIFETTFVREKLHTHSFDAGGKRKRQPSTDTTKTH